MMPTDQLNMTSTAVSGMGPCVDSGAFSNHVDYCEATRKSEDPAALVEKVRNGMPQAGQRLYYLMQTKMRQYFMSCRLPLQNLEDLTHNTFIIVLEAIRSDQIREPDKVFAYALSVARRQRAGYICMAARARECLSPLDEPTSNSVADRGDDPEAAALARERIDLMADALAELPAKHREILRRFYLEYQKPDRICEEMHLSPTQYRLLKSRAKARFGAAARAALCRSEQRSAADVPRAILGRVAMISDRSGIPGQIRRG